MKFIVFACMVLLCHCISAQNKYSGQKEKSAPGDVAIRINEDYSYPEWGMWEKRDASYLKTNVANGLYSSTATEPFEPRLVFKGPLQSYHYYHTDMEFVIINEDQGKGDFTHVQLKVGDNEYRELVYSKKGNWKITGHNGDGVLKEGKSQNISTTNTIRILHRFDTLKYYINEELLDNHYLGKKAPIHWKNIQIFQEKAKGILSLDKVTLIAYYDELSKREHDAESVASVNAYKAKEAAQKKSDDSINLVKAKILAEKLKKKDKLAREVYDIHDANDPKLRGEVKALLQFVEATMQMSDKGEFIRRGSWIASSMELEKYCKNLSQTVNSFKLKMQQPGLQSGENELRDLSLTSLTSTDDFVASCTGLAQLISNMDASLKNIHEMFVILERNAKAMVRDDNAILNLISVYKLRNGL